MIYVFVIDTSTGMFRLNFTIY